MEKVAFEMMASDERDHWWFRARRSFIRAAIARVRPPRDCKILDAGCGSGGNLGLMSEFGRVYGFEFDDGAREIAAATGLAKVAYGSLPSEIPFVGTQFDVVGLFDVLEHLEQPVDAVRSLASRLEPNGALVVTVPAYQWLWGPHDEHCHHFRRYTTASLRSHLEQAGLRVEYVSYLNTLLLPLAILQRIRERVFGYNVAAMPGRSVNEIFFRIWSLERAWIPSRSAPFGLSVIAIARRG